MPTTDELFRQYAIQQGWMPPDPMADASAAEFVPPPTGTADASAAEATNPQDASAAERGANLMFNANIPAGAIPDVGEITIDRGAPPNVRQPTSQVINGAPSKPVDQMTPAEYADYLEAQGAVMPAGKPTVQRPVDAAPPPAGYVTPQDNTRENLYSDLYQRQNDAQTEKDTIAQANAGASGAGAGRGGGMGGPSVVPGGWRRTVSGPVLEGFDELQAQRAQDATDKEIDARLVNQKYAQALEERGAQLQGEQEAAAVELERQQQAHRKAMDDASIAAKAARDARLDPKKAFGDGAGGIIAALAVGFGQIGASLSGGPNVALNIVNKQIDESMRAQEAEMKAKGADADNMLARLKDQTGSLQAAKLAYKQAGLAYAQNQMDKLGPAAKDSELRAALASELQNQLGQSLDFRMKTEQYIPPRVVGGSAPSPADKDQDKIFEGPDGARYVAPNKETRDKLATATQHLQTYKGYANQLDKLRDDPLTYVPGTEENARAKTLSQAMVFEVSQVNELGAISKDDREMVESTLGDPTSLRSRAGAKGMQYGQLLDDRFKAGLRANAVNQVQTGNKLDQRGQLAPTAVYTGKSPTAPKAPPAGFKPVQ